MGDTVDIVLQAVTNASTIKTILQAVTDTPQTTSEIQVKTEYCNKTVVNTLLLLAALGKVEEIQEPWRGRFKFIRKWKLRASSEA